MYQFTTTTIINENKDYTSNAAPLFVGNAGTLKVLRHNTFKKVNVEAIYKRAAKDAELAEVTFTIPATLKKGFYRLAFYVKLSGSANSLYSTGTIAYGKPFYVEFEVKVDNETDTDVAARIVANAKKYQTMVHGEELLKVTNAAAVVTIKATDEYQRISKAVLEKFNATTEIYEFLDAATVVKVGEEGFGTYNHIIKDLKLPTAANTSWTALNQDERPVPGVKYNQYTIYYCVDRGILGGGAVGEVTKSRTTHVFYVNQSLTTAFETALAAVGTVTTV